MAETKMRAEIRLIKTKKYKHDLLEQGKIPAVVYGKGITSESIELNVKEFESVMRKKGRNALIDLVINSKPKEKKYVVMVKEVQREPVRGGITHVDLCKVSLKDKIHTPVPVVLKGEPHGLKNGGIIQTGLRTIEVECLPTEIPEAIPVDISSLEIGDHLTVADLPVMPGYKILTEPDGVLVTIIAPRMAEEAEAVKAEGPVITPAEHEKEDGEGAVP